MDDKVIIGKMLDYHKKFRRSYIQDLDTQDNQYKIFNLLLKKAINESSGTYNVTKDIIRYEKINKMNESFVTNLGYDMNNKIKEIWENSLFMVAGVNKNVLNIKTIIEIGIGENEKLLKAGDNAEKNVDKLEYRKLQIKLENKNNRIKRR